MAKKFLSLKSTKMKKKIIPFLVLIILSDFKQFDYRNKTLYVFK